MAGDPEFKHGDIVTYCWGGFMMRGFVSHIYTEADEYRYVLMEEPEGKPISKHQSVDTHPAYIMQSKHFKGARSTRFDYDKEKDILTQSR